MAEIVKLRENIFEISLFNLERIKKAYSDILGLKHIVHLSINIINPNNEIMFLSTKPNTGINVCGTHLLQFDKSISPSMYKNNEFYFWDSCYQKKAFWELKVAKEMENGILCGFAVIKKINDNFLMYSYGLDDDSVELRETIENMQDYFVEMGGYSFERVYPIFEKYNQGSNLLELLKNSRNQPN